MTTHYDIAEDLPLFAAPARAPAVQSSVTSMAAADAIGEKAGEGTDQCIHDEEGRGEQPELCFRHRNRLLQ